VRRQIRQHGEFRFEAGLRLGVEAAADSPAAGVLALEIPHLLREAFEPLRLAGRHDLFPVGGGLHD